MPQIALTPTERRQLRARAHHVDPVVLIGSDGLTSAVLAEAEAALRAHGLIKVRVFSDDRAARAEILERLADQLSAAPVQHIGKLIVLWRPPPERAPGRSAPPCLKPVRLRAAGHRGLGFGNADDSCNRRAGDEGSIERADRKRSTNLRKSAVR